MTRDQMRAMLVLWGFRPYEIPATAFAPMRHAIVWMQNGAQGGDYIHVHGESAFYNEDVVSLIPEAWRAIEWPAIPAGVWEAIPTQWGNLEQRAPRFYTPD